MKRNWGITLNLGTNIGIVTLGGFDSREKARVARRILRNNRNLTGRAPIVKLS